MQRLRCNSTIARCAGRNRQITGQVDTGHAGLVAEDPRIDGGQQPPASPRRPPVDVNAEGLKRQDGRAHQVDRRRRAVQVLGELDHDAPASGTPLAGEGTLADLPTQGSREGSSSRGRLTLLLDQDRELGQRSSRDGPASEPCGGEQLFSHEVSRSLLGGGQRPRLPIGAHPRRGACRRLMVGLAPDPALDLIGDNLTARDPLEPLSFVSLRHPGPPGALPAAEGAPGAHRPLVAFRRGW
jgi:hypothetical protein